MSYFMFGMKLALGYYVFYKGQFVFLSVENN